MNKLTASPPAFDGADLEKTVKAVCDYLLTLRDEVDFQLGALERERDGRRSEWR